MAIPMRLSIKYTLLSAFLLLNVLATVFFAFHTYTVEKTAFLKGVDSRLMAAARALPHILPADYHDRALNADSIKDAEYRQLMVDLNHYARETSLVYLYTYVRGDDGHFYVASSNATLEELLDDEATRYFTRYKQPSELMIQAYENDLEAILEITDEHGSFRSYFLRMLSPGGRPYLVGADIDIHFVREKIHRTLLHSILAGLLMFAAIFAISYLVSSSIAGDLQRLAKETERIGQFRLEHNELRRRMITALEVDKLMSAVDNMKTNLRSFRKFVPADLVRELVASGEEAELGGQRNRLTVYFSDIVGFTNVAEQMDPEALVDHLGEYLGAMSDEILQHKGTVDKYIGDAIMAFWGAPKPNPQHPLDACRAALKNQQRLQALRVDWRARGLPELHARIGINTGELIVGNVGSETRLDYTVLGDSVNLAARLEGLGKYYGTEILISEPTYAEVREHVIVRPLDKVAVKGKTTGVMVYALLALREHGISAAQQALSDTYARALEAYFARDWAAAQHGFTAVMSLDPHNMAAQRMRERCVFYAADSPDENWDGVYSMAQK